MGSSGSGKSDYSDTEDTRLSDAYTRGAADFEPGVNPYNTISQPDSDSDLNNAYVAGWYDTFQEYQSMAYQSEMLEGLFAMLEGPSEEEQAAKAEEYRLAQGQSQRDAMFSDYIDAAGLATDYVNSEISNELANANLLNIDYNVTDEQKATRINDYFATIWGEGQQTDLETYIKEFGDPEGFEGFTVTRGDGSKYTGTGEAATEETIATSGTRPIVEDEEEGLGGSTGALGV